MHNFRLRPSAEADVQDAFSYYFARGPQLARDLLDDLNTVFDRIRENPLQFAFVEDPVRRALLRKFPYSVYYLVDGDAVSVIGVIHQKRHPDSWKGGARTAG